MALREESVLFNEDSSSSDGELHINVEFAKKYDKWREKEELQKLKDKYGENTLEDSSSASSELSDSEEERELNHAIGKDFLKTISLLKRKDPAIYDKDACFFPAEEEHNEAVKVKKKKKEKPLFWKDQERQVLLEKQGVFSDDEERPKASYLLDPTQYKKEREDIKHSFGINNESDEELLTERVVDKKGKDSEELEYVEWLKGEKEKLIKDAELKSDLEFLQNYWNNSKLDSDEAFLSDFILNKRYIERKEPEVPMYEEMIADEENLSEDEKTLEQQEAFEHKYNFRFEEPDPVFIKKFPRTLKDSLRRDQSKRKRKREETRERKRQEKEKKKEEIKRLKALKRKEIEEKLDQLKEITGNDKMPFDDLDLDGDFDPEKYDLKMKEMFNEEYYEAEEGIYKPVFPPDEEIDENWDNWTGEDCVNNNDEMQNTANEEEHSFVMVSDYDSKAEFQKSVIESTKRNKSKRKSKFAELLSKKKPAFNPELEGFEKYIEEYYKLDCEDIIGDMPVRFSYRKVIPNEFGLSIDEVLSAGDKELNRWCSLKKTCQYRTNEEELYDVQAFKKKSENLAAKKKILYSLYHNEDESQNLADKQKSSSVTNNLKNHSTGSVVPSEHKPPNCSKRKKKHKKHGLHQTATEQTMFDSNHDSKSIQTVSNQNNKAPARQKNSKHQKSDSSSKNFEVSDDRLKAYGINPKRFKKKLKWQQNNK